MTVIRLLALAAPVLLAGCQAHLADMVGPREGIVQPQIARYGLSPQQSRCVAERLARTLNARQLRLLHRSTGALQRSMFDPSGRLTVRDLLHVAGSMPDDRIGLEVVRATASCDASPEQIAAREALAPATASAATSPAPMAARPPAWLNLGAAPTGQGIAIDASSLEQEGRTRTAWFRLLAPRGQSASANAYRLRIDCEARTLASLAIRRPSANGQFTETPEANSAPSAIENGTVMEIAYLSLCS